MPRRGRSRSQGSTIAARPRSRTVDAPRSRFNASIDTMTTPTRRYDYEELVTPKGAAVPPKGRASTPSPTRPSLRQGMRSRSISMGSQKRVTFAHPLESPGNGNKRRRFSELSRSDSFTLDGEFSAKMKCEGDEGTEPIDNYRGQFSISMKLETESDEPRAGHRPLLRATRSSSARNLSPDVNPSQPTSAPGPVLTIASAQGHGSQTATTGSNASEEEPGVLNASFRLKFIRKPKTFQARPIGQVDQSDPGRWEITVYNVASLPLTWNRTPSPDLFSFWDLDKDFVQLHQQYCYERGLEFVFQTNRKDREEVPWDLCDQLREIFYDSVLTPADDEALQRNPPCNQFLWTRDRF